MGGHGLALQNELADSPSPYLRAHRKNPVAWQEWSTKSIELAKANERMIFLSIGYSSCHWCHVMERESFSTPEVASVLNRSFVPIKLDRESRPDLDDIYMNYVTATTGSGGWPLNVFLTPSLQPVFGGTYWPGPSSSTSLVSDTDDKPLTFLDILIKMEDIWRDERERCIQSAADITRQLQAFSAEGTHSQSSVHVKGAEEHDAPEPLELDLLDDALDHFVSRYDAQYGGFSPSLTGPKFPTPANLTLLLRIGASINQPSTHTRFGFPSLVPAILGKESCMTAASMAVYTLLCMSRSGLRDQLGHGFHRYSVTRDWNLPHFEKMACDNAQLLAAYCDAWALGRDPEILGTIYDLVEYFTDPLSSIVRERGGWYSSEGADSQTKGSHVSTSSEHEETKEGAYYVWTLKEFQALLSEQDASILARHLGVKENGNIPAENDVNDEFINQNVLCVSATPSVLAKEFGLREEEVVKVIKQSKIKLQEHRTKERVKPAIDDKVICSWNGLVIAALARAANTLAAFDTSRAERCKDAAIKAVNFIKTSMYSEPTARLVRVFNMDERSRGGHHLAFVDDYAYLIHALIKLYDITFDTTYIELAFSLQSTLDREFYSESSGGYTQAPRTADSSDKAPDQILTLKPGTDNSLPSPNGIIAQNLFYLASYNCSLNPSDTTQAEILRQKARRTIDTFAPEIIQHPFLYASLLTAVVLDQVGVQALIIPSDMSDEEVELKTLRGFGRTVVRKSSTTVISDTLPLSSATTAETEKTNEIKPLTSSSTSQSDELILICLPNGTCRPLRPGELTDLDIGFLGNSTKQQTVVSDQDKVSVPAVTEDNTSSTKGEGEVESLKPSDSQPSQSSSALPSTTTTTAPTDSTISSLPSRES